MFTGIIREIGEVSSISKSKNLYTVKIGAKKVLEGCKLGDSIASNGVCLTVTELGDDYFSAHIMSQTIENTSLKNLKIGYKINLEPALSLADKLDGHLVQGHVDGVGRIVRIIDENDKREYIIEPPKDLLKYLVKRGSVAIDGISLTVSDLYTDSFKVSIIPTSLKDTNLQYRRLGDLVNIETDIVGKYIERFTRPEEKSSGIDMEFLTKYGF